MNNAKFVSYTALSAAFLAVGSNADAQLIYHDFDPDSLLQATPGPAVGTFVESAFFDFNADGVLDLEMRARYDRDSSGFYGSSNFNVVALPLNSAEIVAGHIYMGSYWSSGPVMAIGIANGDTIDAGDGFGTLGEPLFFRQCSEDFCDDYNAFPITANLGIRIPTVGDFSYGWMRVSRVSWSRAMLYEYGFNATPGDPVVAGDTTLMPLLYTGAHDLTASTFRTGLIDSHIKINFKVEPSELDVVEYRIFAVEESSWDSVKIAELATVPSANFLRVFPNGSDHEVVVPIEIPTIDGVVIEHGKQYKMVVGSVILDASPPELRYMSNFSEAFSIKKYSLEEEEEAPYTGPPFTEFELPTLSTE